MRFYLVCIAVLTFMLLGLHSCGAEDFLVVNKPVQAGTFELQGKGGEAKERQLHHRRMAPKRHRMRHALSVAVPRPRPDLELLHPEAYPRLTPAQGLALADIDLRTPQQIINAAFQTIGWK